MAKKAFLKRSPPDEERQVVACPAKKARIRKPDANETGAARLFLPAHRHIQGGISFLLEPVFPSVPGSAFGAAEGATRFSEVRLSLQPAASGWKEISSTRRQHSTTNELEESTP